MSGAPEFSRLVPLARLGGERFRQEIAAGEAERAALARRFDLVALDRLTASVELVRQGTDMVLLQARFEADFVQSCVVTLDPVGDRVAGEFTLLYGPPEAEPEGGRNVEDDVAFEPLVGDAIDIGEAVAQEFSLSLPPFPRSADAGIAMDEAPAASPFAALAHLGRHDGE